MSDSKDGQTRDSHPREPADTILDVKGGLPEATPQDIEALRAAANVSLGADRAARWLIALGHSVSNETLAKRPNSKGEPFSLASQARCGETDTATPAHRESRA